MWGVQVGTRTTIGYWHWHWHLWNEHFRTSKFQDHGSESYQATWVSKILNRALQSSAAVNVPRCRDIQNSMLHLFEFSLPCLETGTSTFLWLMLLLIHDHWSRRFIICSVKLRLSFAWCYGNASHVMWMRAKFQHFASAENVAEVHQDHESRKIEQHDHLSRSSGHLKFTRFNLSLLQLHSGIY